MKEDGDSSNVTRSAVSEGTVIITDEAAQLARTGETADEAVESLNRDTENAHQGPLDENPNLREILDKQAELTEASTLAAQALATTVGDISQSMYEKTDDSGWKEGGIYKTMLQGAAAALVAELGSGDTLQAVLGTMASQISSGKIDELTRTIVEILGDSIEAEKMLANIFTNAISTVIGSMAGGETGGALAAIMDRYNRQLHDPELELILKLATDKEGNVDEELRQRLEDAAFYLVFGMLGYPEGSDEWEAAVARCAYAEEYLQSEINLLKGYQNVAMPDEWQWSAPWDTENKYKYFSYDSEDLQGDIYDANYQEMTWGEIFTYIGKSITNLDTIQDSLKLYEIGTPTEKVIAIGAIPFLAVDGAISVAMPLKGVASEAMTQLTKAVGKEAAENIVRVMGATAFEAFIKELGQEGVEQLAKGITPEVAEVLLKNISKESVEAAFKEAAKNGSETIAKQMGELLSAKAIIKSIDQSVMAAGRAFEKEVLEQLGLASTKELRVVTIENGIRVAFIPDGISQVGKVLVECKDVKKLSMSNQLRAYFASAETATIIVSPKTTHITHEIIRHIEQLDGSIEIYDPITKTFSKWPGL
jgi:histone H3/H4